MMRAIDQTQRLVEPGDGDGSIRISGVGGTGREIVDNFTG